MPTCWYQWTSPTTTDATNVWVDWSATTSYTATTNYTLTSTDTAWGAWIYTTTNVTTDAAWTSWTVTHNEPYVYVDERTDAQRAADEARIAAERAAIQQRADAAAETRRQAIARARALLLSMLERQQREQLQRERFFDVIARHSRRRYRIHQGTHGNVRLLDDAGREIMSYCGQPNGVPEDDAMLAQKLQIEHDEETFLRIANGRRLAVA